MDFEKNSNESNDKFVDSLEEITQLNFFLE